jgi:hypothetical protein
MNESQMQLLDLGVEPCIDGSAGQRANITGRAAEDVIFCILKERGYTVKRQAVIGESIYGTPLRCDFLVSGIKGYEGGLIIESKWQSSSGSADEKYPYLVKNIVERYSHPAILVIGGGGMRPGAMDWLRQQANAQKLIAVYSFEEFMLWAMNNL